MTYIDSLWNLAATKHLSDWPDGPGFSMPAVRTLEDMTEEEIRALEARYGVPVRRPSKAVS